MEVMENNFTALDSKLEGVDENLSTVNSKLEDMEEKLTTVDSNFDDIDTDLNEVKKQLGQVTEGEYFTPTTILSKRDDIFCSQALQIATLKYDFSLFANDTNLFSSCCSIQVSEKNVLQ